MRRSPVKFAVASDQLRLRYPILFLYDEVMQSDFVALPPFWSVGQVIDAPVKIPDKVPAFLSSTPDQQKKNDKAKKYKLLLFNDNVNKREYVAKVLTTTIPDFSQADAYVVMQKAHQSGMAVVGVWVFELAEAYCDGLKARALICSVTEEDD